MAELKQGRWVKVHEPGQANYVESENIMDIVIGADRCQAEATYTVRSYKKAAYWLEQYLKAAEALQIVAADAMEQIQAASEVANREDSKVAATGEGWTCEIEKMADGAFKVYRSVSSVAATEGFIGVRSTSRRPTLTSKSRSIRGQLPTICAG